MLTGLSWLYSKVIDARNSLYARELVACESLPAPTISVGNITVGGTGKTPLVHYIARHLASKDENVCIISRGYGRKAGNSRVLVSDKKAILADPEFTGDEPAELAIRLLGMAYVIADADRVAAAKWAFDEFGVTAFILDDGFQHRRAGRDLDIALVDATNPFGNLKTLPSGILREHPRNLERADLVVVSRANLCDDIESVIAKVKSYASGIPVIVSRNVTAGFRSMEDFANRESGLIDRLTGKAYGFCGLGNPEHFFQQIADAGILLAGRRAFRDHYRYRADDVIEIQRMAKHAGAEVLITTGKDAVKLRGLEFEIPCFVCETELSFENENGFTEILDKAVKRSS